MAEFSHSSEKPEESPDRTMGQRRLLPSDLFPDLRPPIRFDIERTEQLFSKYSEQTLENNQLQAVYLQVSEQLRSASELDARSAIDIYERFGEKILNLDRSAWREGVDYLCRARDLRLARARECGVFDSEVLSIQMMVIEGCVSRGNGYDDTVLMREQLQFAMHVMPEFFASNSTSNTAVFLGLSMMLRVIELMPCCCHGGEEEVREAALAVARFLRLPADSLEGMYEDSVLWEAGCRRIERSYMWGALALYFQSVSYQGDDAKKNLAHSLLCSERQFSLLLEELVQGGASLPLLTTDHQGRPTSVRALLLADAVCAQLKNLEHYYTNGQNNVFENRWCHLMEMLPLLGDQQMKMALERCRALAECYAELGAQSYAARLSLDLARACYQHSSQWLAETLSSYVEASRFYLEGDLQEQAMQALLDGYDLGTHARGLNKEQIGEWVRYLQHLYQNFDSTEVYLAHPLFENPDIILHKIVAICSSYSFPLNNFALLSAQLALAEYYHTEENIDRCDRHLEDAVMLIELLDDSVPGISERFLGESSARIGLLMIEKGDRDFQVTVAMLESGISLMQLDQHSSLELRIRSLVGMARLGFEVDLLDDCLDNLRRAEEIITTEKMHELAEYKLEILHFMEGVYELQGNQQSLEGVRAKIDQIILQRGDDGGLP